MVQNDITLTIKAIDKASKIFNDISKDLKGLGDDTEKTNKKIKSSADKSTKAFRNMAGAVGALGLGAALKTGFDSSVRFEKQMQDISTLMDGDASKAIESVSDGILELTRELPKDKEDLGASAYAIFSAGITDSAKALNVLRDSTRLAVGGLGTTEEATDIMTSALNAFSEEGLESKKVADLLFTTVKNGKTTVAGLAQGFGGVAGQIASNNIKLDDFLASVAALTTSGLPASQAFTQMKAAVSGLTRQTKDTIEVFETLGVKTFKELIEQEGGVTPAFNRIKDAVAGDEDKLLKLIGSTEGYNAVLTLSGTANETYKQTLIDMRDENENLTSAVDKQKESISAQSQLLKNNLGAEFDRLVTNVFPAVIKGLGFIIDQIEKVNDSIKNMTELADVKKTETELFKKQTGGEESAAEFLISERERFQKEGYGLSDSNKRAKESVFEQKRLSQFNELLPEASQAQTGQEAGLRSIGLPTNPIASAASKPNITVNVTGNNISDDAALERVNQSFLETLKNVVQDENFTQK